MKPEEATREVLEKENLCTLSTVSPENTPEAANLQFVVDGDFKLYFETCPSYRKYDNLKENSEAAVVVDERDEKRNVQMEGEAVELEGEEARMAKETYGTKTSFSNLNQTG